MPTIEQQIRFMILCSCGSQLLSTKISSIQNQHHTIHHITVKLCPRCGQEQRSQGFDEGYDVGYGKGYDKGWASAEPGC